MSATVTLQYPVPSGYIAGDYAMLFGNGGAGDIGWSSPLTRKKYDLFPGGAGLYGFGHAPWGHFRFGHAHSMSAPGFGLLPWGHFPFGHGTAVITARYKVTGCGDYKFAFGCYDQVGNIHEGTPGQAELYIHIPPAKPTGLKKNDYNKTTDILTLDAA